MATACAIYKHGLKLATGTVAAGSATISSYSAVTGAPSALRKNVQVVLTAGGSIAGRAFNTRIMTVGASATMKDTCPVVGA